MKQKALRSTPNTGQNKNKITQNGVFNFAHFNHKNKKSEVSTSPRESFLTKYFWHFIIGVLTMIIGTWILIQFQLVPNPQTAVQGDQTERLTPIPSPSPPLISISQPPDLCKENNFLKELWDIKRHYKVDREGYLIQKNPSFRYPYQPITYNYLLPSIFKKLHFVFETGYYNESSESATARISLHYGTQERLRIDMPNGNNRQIIGIWLHKSAADKLQPAKGLELQTKMAFDKTHEIIISSVADPLGNIVYTISGSYLDNDPINPKKYFQTTRTAEAFTVSPSTEELTLTIATASFGQLKIKQFSFCP